MASVIKCDGYVDYIDWGDPDEPKLIPTCDVHWTVVDESTLGGSSSGSSPELLTAADFDSLWGGILLVFAIAFGFKMIRRLIGF